ncbi:MAG: ATP-binding cassette domain-containing protein, partial [Clostridia bacterium]|nr:ATP-binding cassette domain-containing protein [Clostridia bacterium]
MIEVKNLTRKYGEHTAVDSISFNIEDGRIYGFLGPNGAGKTTTMNIITGCLSATDGQVIINGHDIFDEPVKAKKCIGYLPEIPPLYTDMTVLEYLRFVGRAKGLKRAQISASIPDVVAKTGLSDVTNKLIKTLSKGYQQRVGIAQAILGDPQIVILDEPTVGLDPKQIVEIRSLIKELGQKHTVILS